MNLFPRLYRCFFMLAIFEWSHAMAEGLRVENVEGQMTLASNSGPMTPVTPGSAMVAKISADGPATGLVASHQALLTAQANLQSVESQLGSVQNKIKSMQQNRNLTETEKAFLAELRKQEDTALAQVSAASEQVNQQKSKMESIYQSAQRGQEALVADSNKAFNDMKAAEAELAQKQAALAASKQPAAPGPLLATEKEALDGLLSTRYQLTGTPQLSYEGALYLRSALPNYIESLNRESKKLSLQFRMLEYYVVAAGRPWDPVIGSEDHRQALAIAGQAYGVGLKMQAINRNTGRLEYGIRVAMDRAAHGQQIREEQAAREVSLAQQKLTEMQDQYKKATAQVVSENVIMTAARNLKIGEGNAESTKRILASDAKNSGKTIEEYLEELRAGDTSERTKAARYTDGNAANAKLKEIVDAIEATKKGTTQAKSFLPVPPMTEDDDGTLPALPKPTVAQIPPPTVIPSSSSGPTLNSSPTRVPGDAAAKAKISLSSRRQ